MRPTATGCSSPCGGGKTNQEGEVNDVRFVKDGVARAIFATLNAGIYPVESVVYEVLWLTLSSN